MDVSVPRQESLPTGVEAAAQHERSVQVLHWTSALSLIVLVLSGAVILMAHPRLYWGNVGNDLTPALLELPLGRNYKHGGWEVPEAFAERAGAVSAGRTYEIFNQNGWGRSLHFLAGWIIVLSGTLYLAVGIGQGHFRRHVWPGPGERRMGAIAHDLRAHLGFRFRTAQGRPDYGVLQKYSYSAVVFVGAPLMVMTGLAMSPAITAAVPPLMTLVGGFQSARTIHFFLCVALVVFTVGHVFMVVATGFATQMRGMLLRRANE